MNRFLAGLVVFLPSICTAQSGDDWQSLFNGIDLSGWTPKIRHYPPGENFADTFRVEDGLLTVSYEEYENFDGSFGHLFHQQPFSHYRLRLEYRFIGEQVTGAPIGRSEIPA